MGLWFTTDLSQCTAYCDCDQGSCNLSSCTKNCYCSGGGCSFPVCINNCHCDRNCDMPVCALWCKCYNGGCTGSDEIMTYAVTEDSVATMPADPSEDSIPDAAVIADAVADGVNVVLAVFMELHLQHLLLLKRKA